MTSKVEIILMTRNEHIVNVNDLDWVTDGNGDQFVFSESGSPVGQALKSWVAHCTGFRPGRRPSHTTALH